MNTQAELPWDRQEIRDSYQEAVSVLKGNDFGPFTKPAPDLYPHQWNWDSGFIAVGISHYDQIRAQRELSSLFDAQWDNGMVPQIVFNMDELGDYFPEPDFWQADRSNEYPDHVETSGITMPPVHGIAVEKIMENASDKAQLDRWLDQIFPKLVQSHAFFYRERDPHNEGLTYIRHPWESGIDNSPAWDPPLKEIDLDSVTIPSYERKDLDHDIPPDQRPGHEDYDRYVHLIDIYRKHNYDESAIYDDCPFLIQDPLFNSILSRSTEGLISVGKYLGRETTQLEDWRDRTCRGIREKLWSEEHGLFFPYDLRRQKLIEVPTAMSFLPLLSRSPSAEQTRELYDKLETCSFCPMHEDSCFSIPNYDMEGEEFDPDNYWRGPVWININWLLMKGLKRHGYQEKFRSVRADIIELIRRWGFREYFDPLSGKGYGTDRFSWTAALLIDTIESLPFRVSDDKSFR